jgi:hypothetical protein
MRDDMSFYLSTSLPSSVYIQLQNKKFKKILPPSPNLENEKDDHQLIMQVPGVT